MNYRRSQSGVALVITLIMLSVITLIAVAFLALSQRERASVSQAITGTEAEQQANAALDRAKAHIAAEMSAFLATNTLVLPNGAIITRLALGPDLAVSVAGSYFYTNPPNMQEQPDHYVLTNLLYDPPPPVFTTNRTGDSEHVAYLDLNRNGKFDPTGFLEVLDNNGNPIPNQTNFVVGDPQWIGTPARPNERHSSSNRFIGRYAFLIIPVGRNLDIDYIHNNGKPAVALPQSGFYRHDGHGSWEINLAALLADLNPTYWSYFPNPNGYSPDLNIASGGLAFDDAAELVGYRYANRSLQSALDIFGNRATIFERDGVDQFANGAIGVENDVANVPWPGAPNPLHFFSVHDFFNQKPLPDYPRFRDRLFQAGTNNNSFDRYTFYRMLSQLGTDSAPEKRQVNRRANGDFVDNAPINLNYENLGPRLAEQLTNWTAETFFHTTADRLLREYGFGDSGNTPLSVTNLPVWRMEGTTPTNYYSASLHRILQMTLNIFDAMTNRTETSSREPFYPTALRPLFEKRGNDVYIVGYQEVLTGDYGMTNALRWRDLNNPTDRSSLRNDDYVYGVPILIGAKRGYPNFNEFVFQSDIQFERRIQVWKDANTSLPTHAAQMFFIGVSNSFGLEAWNSYSNAFPRQLSMFTGMELSSSLSNDEGYQTNSVTSISDWKGPAQIGTWQGQQFRSPAPTVTNLWANQVFVPYRAYEDRQLFIGNRWDTAFPMAQWFLSNSVHIRFFLFDNGRLVDAVGLAPVNLSTNMTSALIGDPDFSLLWATNRGPGPTRSLAGISMPSGASLQLMVSQGNMVPPQGYTWDDFGNWNQTGLGQIGFRQFLNVASNSPVAVTNQAPFTPQVKICRTVEWRANDPLVHYIDEDLRRDRENKPRFFGASQRFARARLDFDLGEKNKEYHPWEGASGDPSKDELYANIFNTDPNVTSSDQWDFPTNNFDSIKFPSIGWLGRVHRGTPWQTISFKPSALAVDAKLNNWGKTHPQYSLRSHPTNDWRLADLFTVAPHPNASRGRLSVNQTNLAAWSALLSGLQLPMVDAGGGIATNIVEPAVNDPRLDQLVTAINGRRQQFPGLVYSSLEEFVSVPELTVASPYLSSSGTTLAPQVSPLRDHHYEALLEKILSLVKPGEPRFVIYAFGQSLKPAPQSVIPGGNFRGLCVNYEVTGELAARAVARVELDYPQAPQPPGPPRPRVIIESFNILPPD